MVDRPIIFSAPMVCALLAGRKTQTRRLASSPLARCRPGDRLWVRESYSGPWAYRDRPPRRWRMDCPIWYWADGSPPDGDWTKPKPGMHMMRWMSRLTLVVTEVRKQQLQDITEEDALGEGVSVALESRFFIPGVDMAWQRTAVLAYSALWDSLHGEGAWNANPEVLAISFICEHNEADGMSR